MIVAPRNGHIFLYRSLVDGRWGADQGQYRAVGEIDVEVSRSINRQSCLHKARCKCRGSRLKAPPPVRGVPGALYSPRFIARLICNKFRLSLDLFRQY